MKILNLIAALAILLTATFALDTSCKEGNKRCIDNSTAVICMGNGQEKLLFTCPDDQHCKHVPIRPWLTCSSKDTRKTISYLIASPAALHLRDAPGELTAATPTTAAIATPTADSPLNATKRITCKGNNLKRCHRRTSLECKDGHPQTIISCKRPEHCLLAQTTAHCKQQNQDSDASSSSNNNSTAIHARDAMAEPTEQDTSSTTNPTVALKTPPNTDGSFCGTCTSQHGLNQELRTSNLTCRNHAELDDSFLTCRNDYCGLCVLFSERDCQGNLLWSGGRGQSSGDRKAKGAQSYFCY